MKIPKFLIADNSEVPDKIFILHTDYPRFLIDIETEEVEWYDALEEEQDVDLESEISTLIEEAFQFFDKEMASYDS